MKQTFFDLLKAMINATLLLLALCLFLGWSVISTVQDVTDKVTEAVIQVAPVQDRIQNLRIEVQGLRSDIKNRPDLAVSDQLRSLDERLAALQREMSGLRNLPADIVETAARSGVAELAGQLTQLTSCTPPQS